MNTSANYIGIDLKDDYTQLCFFTKGMSEPQSFCPVAGGKDFKIPTVLCHKNSGDVWLYGNEANKAAADREGELVGHILSGTRYGRSIYIDDRGYRLKDLLLFYLKKLIRTALPSISYSQLKVCICLEWFDKKIFEILTDGLSEAGVNRDEIYIINYKESFEKYVFSLDRNIWNHDVILFNYTQKHLLAYTLKRFWVNDKQLSDVMVDKFDDIFLEGCESFDDMSENDVDDGFLRVIDKVLSKRIVTGVFLTGRFVTDKMEHSIKQLCHGRRVFSGDNLFALGACNYIKGLDEEKEDIIYVGEGRIKTDVFLKMFENGREKLYPFLQVGEQVYECQKSFDIIISGIETLEFLLKGIASKDSILQIMSLDKIDYDPNYPTKLRISIEARDDKNAYLNVTDLGFGEIYSGSGITLSERLDI